MCKHCEVLSWPVLIGRGLNFAKKREINISSFERKSGDDGEVDTPVPIPNTEVKHFSAEGSTQVQE